MLFSIVLPYIVRGFRRQYDRIGVRTETDFRRGRDHDFVAYARR